MSFVSGIQMTTALLEEQYENVKPTPAQVREALGEDFSAEQFREVAAWWLSDYGVRELWKDAVRVIAERG